ncbi:MAG: hypothetical protein ACR2FO_03085 [Actinomycetota bacterium]
MHFKLLPAAVAVFALANCGQERLTKAEFIARGDKQCNNFDSKASRLAPAGNPFRPDATPEEVKDGTRFLNYFAVHLPELAGDLRGLGPPSQSSASLNKGLRILDRSGAQFAAAKRALEAGDSTGAKRFLDRAYGDLEQAALATQQYGFKRCGATETNAATLPAPAAGGPEVEVGATEYAFVIPAQLAPGPQTLVLNNNGKQRHFLALVKLKEGVTAEQVIDANRAGTDTAGLIDKQFGQSATALPGGTVKFNVDLEPGVYEYACFIAGPDGELHALKGMFGQLSVAASGSPPVPPAAAPTPGTGA